MSEHDEPSLGDRVEVELPEGPASAGVRTRPGSILPPSARRAALARAWLVAADATGTTSPERAALMARRGMDELGDDYLDPDDPSTVDDTGMKVLAADRTAVPTERATLLVRSLEARLPLYAWRYEERGLAFEPPVPSA